MTTRKLPAVIAVDWIDSSGHSGWQHTEAVEALTPDVVSTVGFLHRETPTAIVVSAHTPHDSNSSLAHSPMAIPKRAILRRRTLIKAQK